MAICRLFREKDSTWLIGLNNLSAPFIEHPSLGEMIRLSRALSLTLYVSFLFLCLVYWWQLQDTRFQAASSSSLTSGTRFSTRCLLGRLCRYT